MTLKLLIAVLVLGAAAPAQSRHEITVSGTGFLLNGQPFPYTGMSFFNAIYNPNFNKGSQDRQQWMRKFQKYGINVLRIWSQWDNKRGFVDTCPQCSLYQPDGGLRMERVATLKQLLADADQHGMVVELALFSQESWHDGIKIGRQESERAATALAKELKPHRNLTIQIWNEFSENVLDYVKAVRAVDPQRLVTNSPGGAGVLGDRAQNEALDYLTPHTTRQRSGKPWEIGPREIAYLLARYRKPVVDDEPARNGTPNFGGPGEQTYPSDHFLQIYQVWQLGAYITYHHDMFQTGYGTPAVPPSGIPDPEFSPYHRAVFEFIALRQRYEPRAR
jgi:hypothetical protein